MSVSLAIPVCSLVASEEDWYFEKEELTGENTGNLAVDDLDHLQKVEFYYMETNGSEQYYWTVDYVSWPDVNEYLSSNDPTTRIGRETVYYCEDSRNFSSWQDCLHDLADHVAFKYYYDGDVVRRVHGICGYRLSCEPYFLDLIRVHLEAHRGESFKRSKFGKIMGGPIKLSFEQP